MTTPNYVSVYRMFASPRGTGSSSREGDSQKQGSTTGGDSLEDAAKDAVADEAADL